MEFEEILYKIRRNVIFEVHLSRGPKKVFPGSFLDPHPEQKEEQLTNPLVFGVHKSHGFKQLIHALEANNRCVLRGGGGRFTFFFAE